MDAEPPSPQPAPDSEDTEDSGGIVELLALALDVLEDEGPPALERFLAAHQRDAPALRRRLALLARSGLEPARAGADPLPETLGDFRLLRPLGSGGMGVVWLAEQISLGREVALKLVRPDHLLFPGARERFRREVEIVARLQHPGIVPVYTVGEERGMPYFAMQRVNGASLDLVLDQLAGEEPRRLSGAALLSALPPLDPGELEAEPEAQGASASELFDGPWWVVCLRIVREVAEALEHARRRNVLHRDVKPSNIMVTRGGRVLLLDFGLSSRSGDSRLTRTGSAVGSMAYMAPELLPASDRKGPPPGDDPRHDVYALGVTLHELLTLSPAFPLGDDLSLIRAILEGKSSPLRKRNRAVPADVATVVAVAMDREASRRYENAGRLAIDLDNLLAYRPIEARSPGLLLRARRWLRRHPVAATALAASLLGPSALLAQQVRARAALETKNIEIASQSQDLTRAKEDLERSLEEEARERTRAEAALEKAMEAVDRMLVRVGDETLLRFPGMGPVRRELLEEAFVFHEWFLEAAGERPGMQIRAAHVAFRAAEVQAWLGSQDVEKRLLERAEELARATASEGSGGDPAIRREARLLLSKVELRHGRNARIDGDLARAEEHLGESRRILEELALDEPEVTRTLSSTLVELGRCLQRRGARVEARVVLEEGVAVLQPLVSSMDPSHELFATSAYPLAHALFELGNLLTDAAVADGAGEADLADAALGIYGDSAELCEALVARFPSVGEYRFLLARTTNSTASVLTSRGEVGRAEELNRLSLQLVQDLVDDHPDVALYLADLGNRHANLGVALLARDALEEAREHFAKGAACYSRYFTTGRGDLDLRLGHAHCLGYLAYAQRASCHFEQAAETYSEAIALVSRALEEAPGHRPAARLERLILESAVSDLAISGYPERARDAAQYLLHRAADPASPGEILSLLATSYAELAARRDIDPSLQQGQLADLGAVAAETAEGALRSGSLSPQDLETRRAFEPLRADESFRATGRE